MVLFPNQQPGQLTSIPERVPSKIKSAAFVGVGETSGVEEEGERKLELPLKQPSLGTSWVCLL